MKMRVEEIQAGDKYYGPDGYHHWTALEAAQKLGSGETIVRVQFRDGGTSTRGWDTGTIIEGVTPASLLKSIETDN